MVQFEQKTALVIPSNTAPRAAWGSYVRLHADDDYPCLTLEAIMRLHIARILTLCEGDRRRAARILDVSYNYLRALVQKINAVGSEDAFDLGVDEKRVKRRYLKCPRPSASNKSRLRSSRP